MRAVPESVLVEAAGLSDGWPQPNESTFDVLDYLNARGVEVARTKPWASHPGGQIHELAHCIFNPDHRNGSAAVTVSANGTIGYCCKHTGCQGRDWRAVRAHLDPANGATPYTDKGTTSVLARGTLHRRVEQWPELIPLGHRMPDPFPLDCVPDWLGEMARAVAESTETPHELSALLAIAVVSSCVAGKAQISPEPGYVEPLNLYMCPAMESGNRRTAVFNRLLAPLIEWEKEEFERVEPQRKQLLSQRRTTEARIECLRKKAAAAQDPRRFLQEIHDLEADLPEPPAIPRLFVEDITPERLGAMMFEQGGRLAVFSDEGGIFDLLAGRYSNGIPNIDLWLKSHSVSPVRIDRVAPGRPPILIDRPHLSVGLSPQPDVLENLRDKPGFRGRGLLARFLYALPQSRLGYRTLTPKDVPTDIEQRYRRRIRDLLAFSPENVVDLRLSAPAYAEWKDFQRALEPQFRDGGPLQFVKDWGGKLAGAAARLAGVYHMALHAGHDPVDREVAQATMTGALELATALIPHALAVFALMDRDPEIEHAEKVLAWILRDQRMSFTVRDCFRSHQSRFRRVDALIPVLVLLEQHGYIRRIRSASSGGRPPSDVCEVNPAALTRSDR